MTHPPPDDPEAGRAGSADPVTVRRDLAVLGASAGGVEALMTLARGLPPDLPMALLVVIHLAAGATSRLPEVISRSGPLPAAFARHGATVEEGHIYIAPPDTHLVVSGRRMLVLDGPRENGFRPAVDPLFRSAARWAGPRAVGVILSGTLDDGAAGMAAIQAFGGATVVQDPMDALCDGMPEAVLDVITPDHVAPVAEIGGILDEIARRPVPAPPAKARKARSAADQTLIADPDVLEATGVDLSCPDCGGALQEVMAGEIPRYRCRVGHVYSLESLLAARGDELEAGLWAALRSLEETAVISGRLARRARESGKERMIRRFDERRSDAATRADLVRQAIQSLREPLNGTTEAALGGELGQDVETEIGATEDSAGVAQGGSRH